MGIFGSSRVDDEDVILIHVNATCERQFGKAGTYDSTVEVPAGNLMKVAAILIKEKQDQLVHQIQELPPSFQNSFKTMIGAILIELNRQLSLDAIIPTTTPPPHRPSRPPHRR